MEVYLNLTSRALSGVTMLWVVSLDVMRGLYWDQGAPDSDECGRSFC